MMYAEWNRHATPAGLTREYFVSGLKSVAVLDVTVEQAWNLWTEMVKETVDYRDFGCALSTIIKGTIDDLTACTLRAPLSPVSSPAHRAPPQSSFGSTRRARASSRRRTSKKSSARSTRSATDRRRSRSFAFVRTAPGPVGD